MAGISIIEGEQMAEFRKTGKQPKQIDVLPDTDIDLILCEWFDGFNEGIRFTMKYDFYRIKTRKFVLSHVFRPLSDLHGYHYCFVFVNGSLFHAELLSAIDLAKLALVLVGHLDQSETENHPDFVALRLH